MNNFLWSQIVADFQLSSTVNFGFVHPDAEIVRYDLGTNTYTKGKILGCRNVDRVMVSVNYEGVNGGRQLIETKDISQVVTSQIFLIL